MNTDLLLRCAATCCAHLKVIYVRIEHPEGTCSDSWKCADCGHGFIPEAWHKSAVDKALEPLREQNKIYVAALNSAKDENDSLKTRERAA